MNTLFGEIEMLSMVDTSNYINLNIMEKAKKVRVSRVGTRR